MRLYKEQVVRFLHTADWHLGRHFHNVSLVDDQAHVLHQFLALAEDANVDAIVIAGDIYDRALPPPEAVSLLDEFLSQSVASLGIPVIMIAGNHDSADRLSFGAKLLERSACHIVGHLSNDLNPISLSDEHGPVHFFGLPYAEPAVVRERTGEKDLHSHDEAMRHLTTLAAAAIANNDRSVLLSHCFVAGGSESESERPLSVGGAGNVSSKCFEPFSYTALGHLHRPQKASKKAHYSGSLLKYSFSEIDHRKSVNLVELGENGAIELEQICLTPRRVLRAIEGKFVDLLEGPASGENREDYLLVRLTDTEAILDPMGRLREIYPNVLHIERPTLVQAAQQASLTPSKSESDEALFASFFQQVTGIPLNDAQQEVFHEVLEALRSAEREAGL
jgi:exonuclease SbcD